MRLKPDPDTFAILPWQNREDGASARMICDVIDTSTGEPFEGDPRHASERPRARRRPGIHGQRGTRTGVLPLRKDEEGRATTKTGDHGGYFDLAPKDLASDVRRDIIYGLGIWASRSKRATTRLPGANTNQLRIRRRALSTADNVGTFRTVVPRHRRTATSTRRSCPSRSRASTARCTRTSRCSRTARTPSTTGTTVRPPGTALLHRGDPRARAGDHGRLEPHCEQLQATGAGIRGTRLRRLVRSQPLGADPQTGGPRPGGFAHRSALPDPSCNPYLALAALIHAGLDGSNATSTVRIRSARTSTSSTNRSAKSTASTLPTNLGEAVEALEEDEVIYSALGEQRRAEVRRKPKNRSSGTTRRRLSSESSTATSRRSNQPPRRRRVSARRTPIRCIQFLTTRRQNERRSRRPSRRDSSISSRRRTSRRLGDVVGTQRSSARSECRSSSSPVSLPVLRPSRRRPFEIDVHEFRLGRLEVVGNRIDLRCRSVFL